MNTVDQECETLNENEENIKIWFSCIKSLGKNFKNCISNECLRFKNWCWKPDPILEFNVVENLQVKSNKLKIINTLKKLI